jgi:hypothetical protein
VRPLYGGIDLHANNRVVGLLNEPDQVIYHRRLANPLPTILECRAVSRAFTEAWPIWRSNQSGRFPDEHVDTGPANLPRVLLAESSADCLCSPRSTGLPGRCPDGRGATDSTQPRCPG